MITYLWLVVGFILLIKGADYFVEGSAGIAKLFHIPSMIIGMTIVAMGTSAPECAVSTVASIKGNNGIAISNAVGSNICNLLLVCGLCAVIRPLPVQISTLKREFPFSIIAQILLLFLGADYLLFGKNVQNQIGHIDGVILLIVFIIFLYWMVRVTLVSRKNQDVTEEDKSESLPTYKCVLYILLGVVAILVGSDLAVDSATVIAKQFGLSETMIGLTIIAIGTSLPELVTSLVAAKKGEVDMAIGNVIGSNIFNVLFVIGIASAISPIAILMESVYDLIFLCIVSIIVLLFASTDKKIGRMEGFFMLVMYGAYMTYVCMR